MHLRYLLNAGLAIPQLPFMYRDGKRILGAVPKLPDAAGPSGIANIGAGPRFRLLCLGESTMAGVGVATHAEGFAGTLATTLSQQLIREVDWRVYAKSGATARRLIQKVLPQIEYPEADLIVVSTAGNDAFKLSTPWKFRRDLEEMIDRLQERYPGTPLAFTNIPPIHEFPAFTPLIKRTIGRLVEFHGEQLERVSEDRSGVYFNPERITLKGWMRKHQVDGVPADFFSDGVHPSSLTYQVWAKDFADFLRASVFQEKFG